MQALLFSAPIARHVGVDDQDVAGVDDLAERDVGGVVEEAPQRRDAGEQADLVARRVEALRRCALPASAGRAGSSVRKNSAVWSRSGGSAQAWETAARKSSLLGQQQRVDVLEAWRAGPVWRRARSRR